MTQSSFAGGEVSLVRGRLHVHVGRGNVHALADGLKLLEPPNISEIIGGISICEELTVKAGLWVRAALSV